MDRVVAVAAGGGHSVALRADGTVWAWGVNDLGQVGDGSTTNRNIPVQVCATGQTAPCSQFLTGVTAIAAGASHSLALRGDGTVVAWGYNGFGQLGNGTFTDSTTPVQVSNLANVTSIAAGTRHSLALRADGSVRAWGYNGFGQLGDGTTGGSSNTPVVVSVLLNATSIAAGGDHNLAARNDGSALAWGFNGNGELGDGTNTNRNVPTSVSNLTNVKSIAAGGNHSLALRTDGTVRAWGSNASGQLGNGTTSNANVPVQVCDVGQTAPCSAFLGGISALATGSNANHSLALRAAGTIRAWGDNSVGQLGDGTFTNRTVPVPVCTYGQTGACRYLDGVTAISAGGGHSLAITSPHADVRIALSASPEPVSNGGNLTYTVTVRNSGPSAAENVVFNDTLPTNVRFVSAHPSRGSCQVPPAGSTDTVTCSLGTLGNGVSTANSIVVTVRATPGSTVTNSATVTSSTSDPNPTNNSATIQTPVS
ncbi:RCC1 domain-containing protein [Streptomyces cellostaticus]|uniref:RCC1 domain-containing protein n=1 Tax=Streptomyces cellostaticus TaxID=67285 RepID=UPI00295F553D|nr:hypothetical protein [Streptomyces cellostaticus]